jgi:hypothetical protein
MFWRKAQGKHDFTRKFQRRRAVHCYDAAAQAPGFLPDSLE